MSTLPARPGDDPAIAEPRRALNSCGRCGHANPPGSHFCNDCGAGLADAPAPAPDRYTPRHLAERILLSRSALEGERKQITVLFADVKGSLELLAGRDPEDARRLLDPVVERMMEAVHHYEGTVNQVMGDGIMALFGAPLAHEDHAVRACYAALRMQEAVRRHAEAARRDLDVAILMRVGLNSGDVVVRGVGSDLRVDYTAVGETVHLAARMEQLAEPGSIVIAPATLRLAEGYVAVRALGPRAVKGLEAPIDVHELVGTGAARSRLEVAVARGLTPFAARARELEALTDVLARVAAGRGEVVAISGEPGLGKSRLLWELTHTDRVAGWRVLEGRALSYERATSYLPVLEILRACLGIEAGADAARIGERIAAHVASLDHALGPVLTPLRVLFDLPVEGDAAWGARDPNERRQEILDAVVRLLLGESRRQPLLVIVGDLHWSDGETLALLDALVERVPAAPLLLVVTHRPEHRHAWSRLPWYRALHLEPLSPAGAEEVLAALLGPDPGLAPLARVLVERTDGNPLFLEESVRALAESGVLTGARGAYRLAKPLASVSVPPTLGALIAARIDRLAPPTKEILQSAAVIGRDVPLRLLVAVTGESEAVVRGRLDELRAAGLLHEAAAFPEPEYAFTHGLTHDVAYGSLLLQRRRDLHARTLEALERPGLDGRVERVERLARHAVLGDVRERAVPYLLQAGQKAAARSALSEAQGYLEEGLDLLRTLPAGETRDRQELELQLALGRVAMVSKGYTAPETERAYARAHELGQRVGDVRQVGPVLVGQWAFHLLKARYRAARALAEQLHALAAAADDPLLRAVAHRALGMTMLHEGAFVAARTHLEQAIEIYDPGVHHERAVSDYGGDPHVACLAYLGRALWFLGYPDQALARSREAVAQARTWSGALGVAQALGMLTSVHQTRRDVGELGEAIARALAYTSERGVSYWQARNMILASWAEAMRADGAGRERSIERIRESLDVYRGTGTSLGLSWFTSLLAESWGAAGKPAAGLAVLDEALAHIDTGERFCEAEVHRLRGELLMAHGGVGAGPAAEAACERALGIARTQGARSWELRAATSLARLLGRRGETQRALEVLAPIYAWFTEGFETADLEDARTLLAQLASAL